MEHLAIPTGDAAIVALATDSQFDAWLAQGRDLLTRRNSIEWELADWLDTGRETFVDQAGFDFLADQLGIAPKKLKVAAGIAKAFPPALRDTTLTFDHYEAVASLPTPEALSVLKDAKARHLDDRETRQEVVKRKAVLSPGLMSDDDWQLEFRMALQRAWNRADRETREYCLEAFNEAEGGPVDL